MEVLQQKFTGKERRLMMNILKLFCHVDDFCQWLGTWENAKLLGVTRKRWFYGFKLHLTVNDPGGIAGDSTHARQQR